MKLLRRLGKAIRDFVSPPTWESITEEQRVQLLSLSRRQRKQLAREVAKSEVLDNNALQLSDGHFPSVDTIGTEGTDAGGAMGNLLGDWRRDQIREAMRQGERNDR
ncbi:MAG: hypothetical protein RJA78_183 [Actinomycetota bacterium]|jgi:hypothetical protein